MQPQTLKGFRDFLPAEAGNRQYVLGKLRQVFETYGFEPLETPALEYEEILLNKYGEEGDKLMYRFIDHGERRVALRYDQTVPLARVIGQHQHALSFPFKRYQIQPVWRAENTQKGRYREFLQCDIDTIGAHGLIADAEIIACVLSAMKALGFTDAKMLINDRSVFTSLKPTQIAAIDKLEKIGPDAVIDELVEKGADKEWATRFIHSFKDTEPTPHVLTVFRYLQEMGFQKGRDFEFRASLARGLDYYTSTIFELVSPSYPSGSLGGGGRYDKLIGTLFGNDKPAVGFAFGFDRLVAAIDQLNFLPPHRTATQVLVTVFAKELRSVSLKIASQLRNSGIHTEIWLDLPDTGPETFPIKFDKQLKYADKKGIQYVIIIGPNEIKENTAVLKNMKTKQQQTVPQDQIIRFLSD